MPDAGAPGSALLLSVRPAIPDAVPSVIALLSGSGAGDFFYGGAARTDASPERDFAGRDRLAGLLCGLILRHPCAAGKRATHPPATADAAGRAGRAVRSGRGAGSRSAYLGSAA